MTIWQFALVTLAVYRVSRMIAIEDGPLDVFAKIRGRFDPNQKTWIGRGLNCILCVSFWIAGLAALITGATWTEWLAMASAVVVWRDLIAKQGD